MPKTISALYQVLQKLLGLHRQLMDCVRMEREGLVQANLKDVQDAVAAKQKTLEAIRLAENERLSLITDLAFHYKRPVGELTINELAVIVQAQDLKLADQFRSLNTALTVLIQRIVEQNNYCKSLVEKSLEHIGEMKRNILGETVQKANTYNPQGQRSGGVQGARLISKEA